MNAVLLEYFAGEKRESLLFILIGMVASSLARTMWRNGGAFRGAAYPLLVVALIQLVVGGTVYLRTDGQVSRLSAQLSSDPRVFRDDELARMDRVMASFRLYKMIEIALIVIAVVLVAIYRPPAIALGIGLGLLLQARVMIVADVVAEHRGQLYLDAVRSLAP